MEVAPAQLETLGGRTWLVDGERTLAVIDLASVLAPNGRAAPPAGARRPAIVLDTADGSVVLLVDALGAQQEIVVRPLSDLIPPIPIVAGSTQLGDGRTILILDPTALVQQAGTADSEVIR